jgi:hypothetical protein
MNVCPQDAGGASPPLQSDELMRGGEFRGSVGDQLGFIL